MMAKRIYQAALWGGMGMMMLFFAIGDAIGRFGNPRWHCPVDLLCVAVAAWKVEELTKQV